ncbi:MAG: N-6 DNA methylase [Acidobacteria bacterium]|nr:N-6 DNA methylase [Acidobacteriota bacterium]
MEFVRREVLPGLQNAPSGVPGQALRRLAPVVETLAHGSPTEMETLIRWSGEYELETSRGRRAAGEDLEVVVEHASGVGYSDHKTPLAVVELMVELLKPNPGERVYDPCFGSGGLLARAAGSLCEQALQMPHKVWADVQQRSVFGVEINPDAYVVGLARVVLAGIEHPGLEFGDALERPLAKDPSVEGFDCILAVPPWGGRLKPEVAAQFPVPATNVETLFLQHVMASLRRGGRAVIALPEAALFRIGADRMVRKALVSEYCVEGVVSLPAGAFRPYTGIKTSLVFFRRERAGEVVRFLQVDEWPTFGPDDARGRENALAVARSVAAKFKHGTSNGTLWETAVEHLATRDWELVAKRTGEEALGRSLAALAEVDAEIPVRPLGEVTEVFAGVSYRRAVTTADGDDPSVFSGLLRVGDVNEVGARRPSLFLTKEGATRVRATQRLRAGDVVLTTSGTIGKLGVVCESTGTVGAVPAKSLVVLRPTGHISPEFLKWILNSDTYQEWLHGHARGSVIQHLSVRALRHVPIPVPALPLQERVCRQVAGERDHSLAALLTVLTDTGEDPILAWLDESSEVQELRGSRQPADPVAVLERVAGSVGMLRNQMAHSESHSVADLAVWLMKFSEALGTLRDLGEVPPGPGRFAILDRARLRLEQLHSTCGESPLPALDSARDLTNRVTRLVRMELESLLGEVELQPGVEPNVVAVGMSSEVQVRLKNRSPLALRNVSVSTVPDIGSGSSAYVAEGQAVSFAGQIPAQSELGPCGLQLRWRADRLDGRRLHGDASLAVDVRSVVEAAPRADLGTSPYIVGAPIDRPEMFFGRRAIVGKIRGQLSTSHQANVILLEGNRRTGKTSILRHLQAPGVLPGWIVVNCSFQGGEGHENKPGLPTAGVFKLMARDIGWAVHDAGIEVWFPGVDSPDPDKPFKVAFLKGLSAAFSEDRPFEMFELYLQAVLEAARPRRLLLMLDEFDKLQEGIDSGVTSPQVPENIRYLLHTYTGLSAVITGSRRLKRLREEYWSALFGFGHRVPVGELPLEDARLLVTRPVEGRLAYVPEATDRVVQLCARQPFLIQSLSNRVFESAAVSNRRTVTVAAVDAAAKEMVVDNEHFRTLWDYAGTERRRFVMSLCQQLDVGPDPITLGLLETKLEEHGIVLPRSDRFGRDLEFLRELELLELRGTTRGSAYALAIPLMAWWIGRNVDSEDQRQKAVRESEDLEGR